MHCALRVCVPLGSLPGAGRPILRLIRGLLFWRSALAPCWRPLPCQLSFCLLLPGSISTAQDSIISLFIAASGAYYRHE